MVQGMAAVLRQMTLLYSDRGKLHQEIQSPKVLASASLLGGVVCIMGNFLLMDSLQKYIHVPRETLMMGVIA